MKPHIPGFKIQGKGTLKSTKNRYNGKRDKNITANAENDADTESIPPQNITTPVIDNATAKVINLEISIFEAKKLIRSIFEEATQHIH